MGADGGTLIGEIGEQSTLVAVDADQVGLGPGGAVGAVVEALVGLVLDQRVAGEDLPVDDRGPGQDLGQRHGRLQTPEHVERRCVVAVGGLERGQRQGAQCCQIEAAGRELVGLEAQGRQELLPLHLELRRRLG